MISPEKIKDDELQINSVFKRSEFKIPESEIIFASLKVLEIEENKKSLNRGVVITNKRLLSLGAKSMILTISI